MVEFLPFEGLRPNLKAGEHIGDRISPPYDVIGPDYLAELQSKPHNITRLTLNPDADKRYHGARAELDSWIADGALKQDTPSFYIYEQTFDDHGETRIRRGIVGILKTEKYEEGNVIPHEETFSKVKADRLNLLRDMEAHLESIFGIFTGLTPELVRRIRDNEKLVCRYVDSDGVEHKYYRLADPEITAAITAELRDQKMLIADGHHRYETALNYALENPDDPKKQYVLATLVPSQDSGLVIWPTHRLVKSGNISEKNAVKGIESALRTVEVSREELAEKLPEHMMGFVFKSGKCLLADCDDAGNDLLRLDTYVAQQKVLYGVFKSDEGKAEVSYDAEIDDVLKKMDAKEFDVAIVLNDPSLDTIWDLAMKGKRMPKKTTYFFPKIWSGFVIYRMA
ncbi:MAG: DUF1015 domain-containing protein [Thermoplasmata archaeon]|nr:DUF1015 domain-containing protein [Thermoplasmata archaeon]